ncbi:MAG TPA: endonuclease MutS2 [Gemmatimonadaceae bacterium]|jgi:DNA mismatch repair protein MutS2|nr:endonuclease MutS2 [Gemmatimonadaceae bacterium]
MNAHALSILELPRVLDVVAGFATSDPGAARVRALTPSADRTWLDREHTRVAAMRSAVQGDEPWHPDPTPDLSDPLTRLRVDGSVWTGLELTAAATLLRSSRRTQQALRDLRRPAIVRAVLAPLIDALISLPALEDRIDRTVQEDGSVKDDASPALRRIRNELRSMQGELVRILEREMSRLEPHHRVADMSVTMRNGRFVIPVRRGGHTVVGGIVHDTSASGGTLFVEPPIAVQFGNRMRELESDEFEEVERILRALTDELRPHRASIIDALDALIELDALFARARYANRYGCAAATLVPARDGFDVRNGRHPLLLAQGADVVAFDLRMGPNERTLLVSGPNTGGKTVLLKALGLISALAQCGIPTPVGAESRIAMFDDAFADVGDEQSIEASLSTFSAHLKNLAEILRLATADSLVLIDELGSGTDPVEGAALGWAILEDLTARGTMTVATTHLGTLKELAGRVDGVVNASLQFDAVALAPTYRLIKGIPGRSYGISIARRLNLPDHVVARAEERLPQHERDVAALIEQLEKRDEELKRREAETAKILDDARTRTADVSKREQTVRERERVAEKSARQDTRRYLLDARAEIDRTIKALKSAGVEALEEAGREARKRAEELAAQQNAQLERLEREEANLQRRQTTRAPQRGAGDVGVGDTVEVGTLGGKLGRLMELRDGDAVVAVGAIKLTVPLESLTRSDQAPQATVGVWTGDIPEVHVLTEIDLRGMRPDEAEAAVLQALDAAVSADLKSLRIIHGKGTGVLRDRVAEMLRKDTRVRDFRLGAWNEGGAGVTLAEFA